jgi:aspartate-semialdehyde dehydrogenase
VSALAASPRSAGTAYGEVVKDRWMMESPIPEKYKDMIIIDASDVESVRRGDSNAPLDFVFCAVDMKKSEIAALEQAYAKAEIPVISNNSAHRSTPDVPMIIPEINPEHTEVVQLQRKRLGTKRGFIAVKSNCSIQSYVPALHPLMGFGIKEVVACTYQAISGAGKNFDTWPEMVDNVIPYIGGEEEKSEQEPLKVWGQIKDGEIVHAAAPVITTQCIRVPASDGHMAAVFVRFEKKPAKEEILTLWDNFNSSSDTSGAVCLPSSPKKFLTYFTEDNFPQTKLHRNLYNGMGISIGRLREDSVYDYKFICLSHNTLRGAAGGAVLMAELFAEKGYFD